MSNSFFFSPRRWYTPLLSFSIALGIGASTPEVTLAIPWLDILRQGVQVYQLYNVSNREEVQLGQRINQQLVGEQFQLYNNARVNSYVDRIGQRLAKNSTRPDIPYTFQVVKDDSINAFATAGGYVYVTTGLLKAADNEAQLAGVLAHEIGHIAERHLIEQMRETAIARGLATAAGIDDSTAVQLGVELALRRPNSREDEFEADARGVQTLGKAGYAQVATIDFLEKLRSQRSTPTFLSTHPATSDRIARLREIIDSQQANRGEGLNESNYQAQTQPLN
ncbi:M48 family metalloprotease [Chroococcidiopsis sp. FACHB-1243]|uniref:M48 family metallopeptidase n=1 Tax=Chroococcidiopsis sp. [FACHB-1243] TaxID=2692781 RepID=UPI0017845FF0|nr:M48 family metallopeptidase [Chroococcidiopsis sp. [FACHB-1243]]MBD2307712.1 M48 family metalloprotease [Chroococcidiopsis sp. [FACHB-1243]]